VREAGINYLEAAEVAHLIRTLELTAEELKQACLGQTGRTNPHVNGMTTGPEYSAHPATEDM